MAKKEKKKKSLFRRIMKWTGITFLLLLIALILIPIFFKDQLKAMAIDEANKMLNKKVVKFDVKDFDLTFISTFPHMTARFYGVTLKGQEKFDGVMLADIKQLDAHVNFWSVIGGEQVEIEGISIEEPKFDVRILNDGTANYDIVKPDSVKTPEEKEEPSNFKLTLQDYAINNAQIRYDDQAGDLFAVLKNMTHTGTGDLTADVIDFKTTTKMDELTFKMEGLTYLSKVKTDLVANLLMEFSDKSSKFTLKENSLRLNALKLSIDGFYEMLEKNANMDLKLNSSKATFKDFLSLIPAFYKSGYESMVTQGKLALRGEVKGTMDNKNMPGWDAGVDVENASIKYPSLAQSIKNITIKAGSKFPGGSNLDKMTIDVPKFHADFAGNKLDANLKLRNPETDPHIDSKIFANVNLATLGQVIPMAPGESYSGKLDADVALNGKMSSIESGRYQEFKAEGMLKLMEMLYKSADLAEPVNIKSMIFKFTPNNLTLENLDAKMGRSDFRMNGKIDNYLNYLLGGKQGDLLKGSFDLNSNNIDLDQTAGVSTAPAATTKSAPAPAETSTEALLIPENVDFNLNTNIANVRYNNIDIKNVKGNVGIKEEVASLNGLTMNAMGGAIGLKGSYDSKDHNKPKIDFGYDLKELDIAQLVKNFVTIEKLAPIAKYAQGKISSSLNMHSFLKPSFEPIYATLTGDGNLFTNSVTISGFEPLKKLSSELKMDKLATQTLKNVSTKFKFADGKVSLTPFTVKLGNIATDVSGTSSIEQAIDYKLTMNIPKEEIPASMIKLAESGIQKVNGITPKIQLKELPPFIKVNANIIGTITNPKVTTDLKDQILKLTGNFKETLKEAGKQAVGQIKDTAKAIITNKVNEVKEDLNKKKQEILDAAQKQADNVKAEGKKAADKIRSEADKAYDQAVAAAGSNPLKKKAAEVAAKKVKDGAYKKADQTENEANTRADDIMSKARDKADQVK